MMVDSGFWLVQNKTSKQKQVVRVDLVVKQNIKPYMTALECGNEDSTRMDDFLNDFNFISKVDTE